MNESMPQSDSSQPGGDGTTLEFRCSDCGQLLRVSNGTVGRSVRCPQCQQVMQVPDSAPSTALGQGAPIAGGVTPAPGPLSAPNTGVTGQPGGDVAADSERSAIPPAAMSFGDQAVSGAAVVAEPASAPREPMSENARRTKELFDRVTEQTQKIFIGQHELVQGTMVALFSGGHVLIESVPGLGKTLFIRALGKVLGCKFGRIQFTADLMPSDITGAPIFNMKTQDFEFRPGPVFTQLLLADEINRSPAKTHAALLEIMQEYRVTIDRVSHKIERPFLVMATQNPIESEGTYNLPEAQLDRFMFKIVADYPSEAEEADVLRMHREQLDLERHLEENVQTVADPAEILEVTRLCRQVRIDDRLLDYINLLVRTTRGWPHFYMGASPRAGIALLQGARTLAAFNGRDYAVPDDVVQIALPSLRHRVMLTAEAEVEGRQVDDQLQEMIRSIEVPRL